VGGAADGTQWLTAPPRWVAFATVTGSLGIVWALTYATGGSHSALPHGFYLPIVVAGLAFGGAGAVATAVVAAVLVGPLMPQDVAAGTVQELANWLTRGAFFVLVGAVVGGLFSTLRRAYTSGIVDHLERDLDAGDLEVSDDPDGAARVRSLLRDTTRLQPVFQPIYSLAEGRLVAVEALTRFATEEVEPPDIWFARARRAGMSADLELAAIDAALAVVDRVVDPAVDLSLNCSPATICDPRLPAVLEQAGPRRVLLEITEHAVVDDYQQLEQVLPGLRARGIALAVDDVGAGFASLRHILKLAPDVIKLDISLTQGLRSDPVRRALAECLVGFASSTGIRLVAEGIEDRADLAAWCELGADAVQGYLLGRPLPSAPARHAELLVDDASRTTSFGGRLGLS
jgi:EAL domain-containing protein (putative c-di-GMP-specific phosphodiesterase class I)